MTILNELPNGITECFLVIDTGYFMKTSGIPEHYETKVKADNLKHSVITQETKKHKAKYTDHISKTES